MNPVRDPSVYCWNFLEKIYYMLKISIKINITTEIQRISYL